MCEKPFGLAFLNVTKLTLENLSIVNCGAKLSTQLAQDALTVQNEFTTKIGMRPKAALFAVNIHSLMMTAVEVRNSSGHGLLGINLIGNSEIVLSQFVDNNVNSYSHCWSRYLSQSQAVDCQGGNALLLYGDLLSCPEQTAMFNVTVNQSIFARGVDFVEGIYNPERRIVGSGLGAAMIQRMYGVRMLLEGSVFTGNTAVTTGANLNFAMYSTVVNSSVTIRNCHSTFGNSLFTQPSVSVYPTGTFSALTFIHGILDGRSESQCKDQNTGREGESEVVEVLRIENSSFTGNVKGALLIQFATGFQTNLQPVTQRAVISNSDITGNFADLLHSDGPFVLWAKDTLRNSKYAELVIENSRITYNKPSEDIITTIREVVQYDVLSDNFQLSGTMKFSSMNNVTIQNCSFVGNFYSPIHATDSNIYFSGYNSFVNNTSIFGGALYLTKDSVAYLDPQTQIRFENNFAFTRGGAIYITDEDLSTDFNCPVQVFDPTLTPISEVKTKMTFINNTALLAGDALYGGNIDKCVANSLSAFLLKLTGNRSLVFDSLSDFTGQPKTNSLISSKAKSLCYCRNGIKDCENNIYTVTKYPGEAFQVSMVGVGQRQGNTPSLATVVKPTAITSRRIGRDCTDWTYSASTSTLETHSLNLTFFADNFFLKSVPLFLVVVLRPCPVGFELDSINTDYTYQQCDCVSQLRERNMTNCDITTGNITCLPPYWLSNYSQHLLLHDHCPFDYCKTTPVQITLKEPDISKQCAFNRTGTLCGQCKEGLSLVFGTSRCLPCSNKYLALFIAFAVAGIALVVFLFLLDLTVSIGTINGLIFYANIVKINEAIFFPPGDNSFLKVFISWVNLDLGIETCFYNGMDSYVKTWFQFIFPLYVWLILIVIIAGARKSITLARLCGNHAVPVLATLFLFSFTKLLRVIITALSFTTLAYPNGRRVLWLYDGNVEFGKQKYIALLLFATLFLFALIPYTVLLTTVQVLRRWSDKKCFWWVSKYMPIFDAYLGPYKHKYGYWTGLLLVVRVVLVLVFVFNIFGDPAVNILVIILVVFLLVVLNLGQGGVYKNNYLTALEISFMLNLGVLTAVTGYVRQTNGNQKAAVYTSTSIALGTFAVILIYHDYDKIRTHYRKWQERRSPVRYKVVTQKFDDDAVTMSSDHKPQESIVDIHLLETAQHIQDNKSDAETSDGNCPSTVSVLDSKEVHTEESRYNTGSTTNEQPHAHLNTV